MKEKFISKALAAVTAAVMLGGGIALPADKPLFSGNLTADAIGGCCSFDKESGTLTLHGNVVKEEVKKYSENSEVKKVICEKGTVFPEDCFGLFGCFEAEEFDLSNADTSKVTDMGDMFTYCDKLKTIDLSGFDTRNVTSFSCTFSGCKALTSLDLSSFDTSKAITMFQMFEYCEELRSLNISSFDTSNVEEMIRMFDGCLSLKSLDLSSFTNEKVHYWYNMFKNCPELRRIYVSDKWTIGDIHYKNGYNSDGMFLGCEKLVGGNGTEYDEKFIDAGRAHIDTYGDPGYLTSIKDKPDNTWLISLIQSLRANISLSGDITLNIIVKKDNKASKAKLSGPNGDIIINDLSRRNENGDFVLSYPVNATQLNDNITVTLYDDSAAQEDDDIVYQTNYSIKKYIESVSDYISDDKALALTKALDNYGKAAENYFKGAKNTIEGIGNVSAEDVKDHALPADKDLTLSLVLNSATAMRIYTDSDNVVYKGEKLTSKTSKYGKYYEIENILAQKLSDKYTVVIDGTEYSVSPMSYVYKVLTNENASPALVDMAKAVYVYAKAAREYIG